MKAMKKIAVSSLVMGVLLVFAGCASSKDYQKVAYFQNADEVDLEASSGLYDMKIKPLNYLNINVTSTDMSASAPFNLRTPDKSTLEASSSNGAYRSNYGDQQTYCVSNNGTINFPVIGKLKVVGLTMTQCEDLIQKKISPYFTAHNQPVVKVQVLNFVVTVTGEVASPQVINVTGDRISILEAIAQAGDLTIYGRRDNVMLIREDASGAKVVHRYDLNDANILNDPYYYLDQNDVVYVEPNGVKKGNADMGASTTLWLSVSGLSTSVISLIYNIAHN